MVHIEPPAGGSVVVVVEDVVVEDVVVVVTVDGGKVVVEPMLKMLSLSLQPIEPSAKNVAITVLATLPLKFAIRVLLPFYKEVVRFPLSDRPIRSGYAKPIEDRGEAIDTLRLAVRQVESQATRAVGSSRTAVSYGMVTLLFRHREWLIRSFGMWDRRRV
jgi:hypothetical protein